MVEQGQILKEYLCLKLWISQNSYLNEEFYKIVIGFRRGLRVRFKPVKLDLSYTN